MDHTGTQTIETIIKKGPSLDAALIRKAFTFASSAHKGQKRASGEPYITHPVAAARIIADLHLDTATIAAGLLHDTLEDTPVTKKELEREFGSEIAFLVDGVTKLKQVPYQRSSHTATETLKKIFFAMAEDIRVILIKLADRLHNLETLDALPENQRRRIALESIEIYAPTADRLGMGEIKGIIEDRAFPHAHPEEYARVQALSIDAYEDRLQYLSHIKPLIGTRLAKHGIHTQEINSRAKHQYSLYKKLKQKDWDIERIYDLVAVRIILPTVENCYEALGIIHTLYHPLPGHIKDYIALPKSNGYQSLHTTVLCEKGKVVEIQLRTPEMHRHAEYGVAAHWAYSESGKLDHAQAKNHELKWINKLRELKRTTHDSQELFEDLKSDAFQNRLFAYTPKGDIKDLPEGATPVDFAYTIHTDIGHLISGAKVNGKMVPLSHRLRNGDIVEVLTSKNRTPSRDWLNFVRMNETKKKIRSYFKQVRDGQAEADGEQFLNRELRALKLSPYKKMSRIKKEDILKRFSCPNDAALFRRIGKGDITPFEIIKETFKEKDILPEPRIKKPAQPREVKPEIFVDGASGILTRIAKCCTPGKADNIIGYLTKGHGITVHARACTNVKHFSKHRIRNASWTHTYPVTLDIRARDRVGLLKDIGTVMEELGINIRQSTSALPKHGITHITTTLEIRGLEQLENALLKVKEVKNVLGAKRI